MPSSFELSRHDIKSDSSMGCGKLDLDPTFKSNSEAFLARMFVQVWSMGYQIEGL